ncbi:hypothetical protein [Hugenholtzia roseola]|uniref:hypothetical protein n=1 Tax=Hugenholtzia roseola TaxID=1002 RepID=UPI0004088207|nr:hypothetical protein [Hugenholtzia roseola]
MNHKHFYSFQFYSQRYGRGIWALLLLWLVSACGNAGQFKTPTDEFVRNLDGYKTYSVILYDIDKEDNFLSANEYRHRYKFILPKTNAPNEKEVRDSLGEWLPVSENFFMRHIDDMGMELVSKGEDGKVSKVAAPPGYNRYVGNTHYGYWHGSGSSSVWHFYGQYAFMRDMMGLGGYPIYQNRYDDYRRNYSGRSPYYGTSSTSTSMRPYGTTSVTTQSSNPNSFKSRVSSTVSRSPSNRYASVSSTALGKSSSSSFSTSSTAGSKSSFQNKVSGRVSRSSSAKYATSSSSSSSSSSSRISRSSSRYSGSSGSSYSRSGSSSRGGK